jgi:hypothetical protein
MKRIIPFAVLALLASRAVANDLSGRALLAFERYESNAASTSGFRQTYDLRLDRAFTDAAHFRIFFRGDDFRGTAAGTRRSEATGTRQLQPGAEFFLNSGNVIALARSEYFDTRSHTGPRTYDRTIERSTGSVTWMPTGLPVFRVLGQRNRTNDDAANIRLTDENALASVAHEWRGLTGLAESHYSHSVDPNAGYDRRSRLQNGSLAYNTMAFNGKLSASAEASAQLTRLDETALSNAPSSVPTPVVIAHVAHAIDETPLDGRDHPPVVNSALNDGDLNVSAAISLGPDAASFQNFVIDIGHIDRVDEIRVVVRDPSGNPMRNGGGPVSLDVYTSEDGQIWTPLRSSTSFNAPLSLYAVAFDQISGRWVKVVNFGVNAEASFVTEVQAYYHTTLRPGEHRRGDQTGYNGNASLLYRPVERFSVGYTGLFSTMRQELGAQPPTTTRDVEHLGSIEYLLSKKWGVRAQYLNRAVRNFARAADGADGLTAFLDYAPTEKLRMTLEAGGQRQTLDGTSFKLETHVLHVTAYVLRSFLLTFDGGTQTQTIDFDGSVARRQFLNMTGNVQLWPAVRMLLNGSMQRARSDSSDPAVQLLGATRDNRVSSDVIWRPGRELVLGIRAGWVSGPDLSGFTERYHVEWYPFGQGTVSLGGSYDQDIDPTLNRRATRMIFNPRWVMNRFATFDLNYTSVKSTSQSASNFQRTLFATLTLSR